MINVILFAFTVGVFAGGFWCGKTYGSFKAMCKRAADALKSSLS